MSLPLIKITSFNMPPNPPNAAKKQQGITLLELMISIALGLIVSAAAFMLFTNSINSQRIQSSASDVQEAAIFNLNFIKKEIAMANLGASTAMKQETPWTGIVLTGSTDTNLTNADGDTIKTGNLRGLRGINNSLLTKSGVGKSNLVSSEKSDQLTIQYKAAYDSYDCEGKAINQGDMVIERFFTRVDNQKSPGETAANNLAIVLACDAGRYELTQGINADNVVSNTIDVQNFGDNGAVLVNRIDYFGIKLGIKTENGLSYLPINEYMEVNNNEYSIDAPIFAVQLGVIVRGNSSVSGDTKETFTVNGEDYTIENGTNYVRRVYENVISLRNNRSEP